MSRKNPNLPRVPSLCSIVTTPPQTHPAPLQPQPSSLFTPLSQDFACPCPCPPCLPPAHRDAAPMQVNPPVRLPWPVPRQAGRTPPAHGASTTCQPSRGSNDSGQDQDQDPEEEEASFAQSLSHGWSRDTPMVEVWL